MGILLNIENICCNFAKRTVIAAQTVGKKASMLSNYSCHSNNAELKHGDFWHGMLLTR